MGVAGAVVVFILAGLKFERFGRAEKLPNTSKSALLPREDHSGPDI